MNPYCRRAVSKAVELAAERAGSQVTVVHARSDRGRRHVARSHRVGPRPGRRHQRRAHHRRRVRRIRHTRDRQGPRRRARPSRDGGRSISCWPVATRSTPTRGRSGPSSPSCSTCRSSPAFATSRSTVRTVDARCEHDDGWMQAEVSSRRCCRAPSGSANRRRSTRPGRAAVPADRIRSLTAADLGPARGAPTASPTWVGPVKVMAVSRAAARPGRRRRSPSRCATQCTRLHERGALREATPEERRAVAVRGAGDPARRPRSRSSPSPTARTPPASSWVSRRASPPTSTDALRDHPRGARAGGARDLGCRRDRAPRRCTTSRKTLRLR